MLLSYAYTFNFQVWCILYMYVYCMLINFSRKNSDFGPFYVGLGVIFYEFIFNLQACKFILYPEILTLFSRNLDSSNMEKPDISNVQRAMMVSVVLLSTW